MLNAGVIPVSAVTLNSLTEKGLDCTVDFGSYTVYRGNDRNGETEVLQASNSNADTLTADLRIPRIRMAVAVPGLSELSITLYSELPADSPEYSEPDKLPPAVEISDILYFRELPYRLVTFSPLRKGGKVLKKLNASVRWQGTFSGDRPQRSTAEFYKAAFINGELVRIPGKKLTVLRKSSGIPPGIWVELNLREPGIYAIEAGDLEALSLTPGDILKNSVRLFADSRYGRSYTSELPDLDNLYSEVPVLFLEGSGDTWQTGDKMVFWAPGPDQYYFTGSDNRSTNLRYSVNPYERYQHLWLFIPDDGAGAEAGRRMEYLPASGQALYSEALWHWAAVRHEQDEQNIIQGGINWYGESFSGMSGSRSVTLDLGPAPYTSAPLSPLLRVGVAGASKSGNDDHSHTFFFKLNNQDVGSGIYITDYEFTSRDYLLNALVLQPHNALTATYSGDTELNLAFLDYFDIVYPAENEAVDNELTLRFQNAGLPFSFRAGGFSAYPVYGLKVDDPWAVSYSVINSAADYINDDGSDATAVYFAAPESEFRTPFLMRIDPDFNMDRSSRLGENYDFVIITHSLFREEAERLAAHKAVRIHDPLKTLVMDIEDIYNCYSGGQNDPYAIRNFLLDLYRNNGEDPAGHVLLMGDGSYDYKNISGKAVNYIPQFEVSAGELYDTRNSEDFFVYLTSDNDQTVDMALGRLAVNSQEEAAAVVDKIISYENRENPGIWQGRITLVADDPTDPDVNWPHFINNTENVIAPKFPLSILRNKIYLTEFPELYDASIRAMGRVGAREAIIDAFNQGTVLMNWIGHGSPTVWAQEYVFVKDRDLPLLKNSGRYPLIVAMTCDWGRSDYISSQSAAEDVVNMPEAGAVAALASTRPVFDSANVDFVTNYYSKLFYRGISSTATLTIGEALMAAKLLTSGSINAWINSNKFLLIGDPTLRLAIPDQGGAVDHLSSDTLRALNRVDASAYLSSYDGTDLTSDGMSAEVQLYDSKKDIAREYRYYTSLGYRTGTLYYSMPGSALFSGVVSVEDAALNTSFIIPKDISYQGESGVLRVQYHNDEHSIEGLFARTGLVVRGSDGDVQTDFSGPRISVQRADGRDLVSGDVLQDSSLIIIALSDTNGINITGSTGHSIGLTINGGTSADLTSDFSYDRDSFTKGHIQFRAGDHFSSGTNEFEISAFDNYNNYSSISGEINVLAADDRVLNDLVNFPNPFRKGTQFTFQAAVEGTARISVYSSYGRKVTDLPETAVLQGFNYIDWDGLDSYGQNLAAGPYFYIISFRTLRDETFEERGTLIKIP